MGPDQVPVRRLQVSGAPLGSPRTAAGHSAVEQDWPFPLGPILLFIGVGRGRKVRQVMLFGVPGSAACGLLVFSKALLPGTDTGLPLGGGGVRGASWRRDESGGPSTTWPLSGHTGGKSLYPFRRQTPVASGQAPGRPALG